MIVRQRNVAASIMASATLVRVMQKEVAMKVTWSEIPFSLVKNMKLVMPLISHLVVQEKKHTTSTLRKLTEF